MTTSDMLSLIKDKFALEGSDPAQYSPLSLAFIGDSVYGLIVKTMVVLEGNCPANRLDAKAVKHVKSPTTAKNAPVGDYRKATGLEAVIGYLYLMGQTDRVVEIIREAVKVAG